MGQCVFTAWAAAPGAACSAACGAGLLQQLRVFLAPDTPSAQALCNASSALSQTVACNVQACAAPDASAFPFVSFASVVEGDAASAAALPSEWTDASSGGTAVISNDTLALVQARERLRANVSAAVQAALQEVLLAGGSGSGGVAVSQEALAWLRALAPADVLIEEPPTQAAATTDGAVSSTASSTVSWRISLPLQGAAGGGGSVSAALQLLLSSGAGATVAAEIAGLLAAAVTRACADASLALLVNCPAGQAPRQVPDPATQLAAGTAGNSAASSNASKGELCSPPTCL